MMCFSPLRLTFPSCNQIHERETVGSFALRITAVGVGGAALLIGILVLSKIPQLQSLKGAACWAFLGGGGLALLSGISLKCVKKDAPLNSFSDLHATVAGESVDFSSITPQNYEQILDVSRDLYSESYQRGNFIFRKSVHQANFSASWSPAKMRKGDLYLWGRLFRGQNAFSDGLNLEIQNGQFIHYPQMSKPAVHFTNLADFFNYLFRGEFYQGELTKDIPFFSLATLDGSEIRYNNPYKS